MRMRVPQCAFICLFAAAFVWQPQVSRTRNG